MRNWTLLEIRKASDYSITTPEKATFFNIRHILHMFERKVSLDDNGLLGIMNLPYTGGKNENINI